MSLKKLADSSRPHARIGTSDSPVLSTTVLCVCRPWPFDRGMANNFEEIFGRDRRYWALPMHTPSWHRRWVVAGLVGQRLWNVLAWGQHEAISWLLQPILSRISHHTLTSMTASLTACLPACSRCAACLKRRWPRRRRRTTCWRHEKTCDRSCSSARPTLKSMQRDVNRCTLHESVGTAARASARAACLLQCAVGRWRSALQRAVGASALLRSPWHRFLESSRMQCWWPSLRERTR